MDGKIVGINGPLVVANGLGGADAAGIVRIGSERLFGEILTIEDDIAKIRVFEETRGLGPGAEVQTTGAPLSVELGPGLLENIYDGLQRPLTEIQSLKGWPVPRGDDIPALDRKRLWEFDPVAAVGDEVTGGSIIGTVIETPAIVHKIMIPHGISGLIESIEPGSFTVEQTVCTIKTQSGDVRNVSMMQRWPVRDARPFLKKSMPATPLVSGQRLIDTLFPIAKGGAGAVIGAYGSGKTVLLQQLAKWSDAGIVVYIGCGERGSEMKDTLSEFSELRDPRSGETLIKRTVLIASASDMPIAAREAAIYTGLTIAEYYRDMGYDVAVIADSTTRWAEALREISRLMKEQTVEEGYPAYLGSRLAQFYGRAGLIDCIGGDNRKGSLTAIGAVSPSGGDLPDPVSQATKRIVKVLWDLDESLSNARYFPAVNRFTSYSLYTEQLKTWFDANFGIDFAVNRSRSIALLREETELQKAVKLYGHDSLSALDRVTLETAKIVREDFLQQNAADEADRYTSLEQQATLLSLILYYHDLCKDAISAGADDTRTLFGLPVRRLIERARFVPSDEYETAYRQIAADLELQIGATLKGGDGE